ncbi:MAG: RT0821/Lpp0805 family surface protein [Pseudomonadota bacterium]
MFHLLFAIIFLPFTLLRMLFGLFGISTALLLFPLKFFARNTVLCLIVAAGVILYLAIKKDPTVLKPAPQQDRQASAPQQGAPILIEPVSKYEDGDSAFATDVYNTMTDPERATYSNVFYSTMSHQPTGTPYVWSNGNIGGTLTPTSIFKNNSGENCRAFTETLKVHRVQQTITGTACVSGPGTWCKLKPNATQACGLGNRSSGGMLQGLTKSIKSLF